MRKKSRKRAELKSEMGPVRHAPLAPALTASIKSVARTLSEVGARPAAEWIAHFRRDEHPENEVAIWEAMAAAYVGFIRGRSLSLAGKKEAFHFLLLRSTQDEQTLLGRYSPKHLEQADVAALLAAYNTVPAAEGWGLVTAAVDSGAPAAGLPGDRPPRRPPRPDRVRR